MLYCVEVEENLIADFDVKLNILSELLGQELDRDISQLKMEDLQSLPCPTNTDPEEFQWAVDGVIDLVQEYLESKDVEQPVEDYDRRDVLIKLYNIQQKMKSNRLTMSECDETGAIYVTVYDKDGFTILLDARIGDTPPERWGQEQFVFDGVLPAFPWFPRSLDELYIDLESLI